jgi:hypothetical protein
MGIKAPALFTGRVLCFDKTELSSRKLYLLKPVLNNGALNFFLLF